MGDTNATVIAHRVVAALKLGAIPDDGVLHVGLERLMQTLLKDSSGAAVEYLRMLTRDMPPVVPSSVLIRDAAMAAKAESNSIIVLQSFTNILPPYTFNTVRLPAVRFPYRVCAYLLPPIRSMR